MRRTLWDTDDDTDLGPDGRQQRRLPAAGHVRLVENPTPTFDLPPQRDGRSWNLCAGCDRFGPVDPWTRRCHTCQPQRGRWSTSPLHSEATTG